LLPDASKALYLQGPGAHGFLLFRRDGALVAQAFDLKALTLSGDVFKIAEDVSRDDNAQMMASVAANGVLVYETGRNVNTQLTWLDRAGKVLSVAGPVRPQHSVALSPHGDQIIVTRGPLGTIYQGLWQRDAARVSESRLVAPPLSGVAGVWSPDGRMVAFAGEDGNLYRKDVSSGAREELILKDGNKKNTSDWSRDGRYLLFTVTDPKTKGDIWVLPDPGGIAGASKPYPFQRTDAVES
jgi:WD40 repeat protein